MRKLISLILVLITLLALCVPAMAEEEPYETVSYVYSSSGGSDNFSFYSNYQDTIENAWKAGDTYWYFKLFANEKSGLQIDYIELRYVSGDFAKAGISGGTKVDPDKYYQCGDWLRINNIHSKVFTIGDYYETITFDEIRVYYEDAEIIEEDHEVIYFDFDRKSYSENFCLECGETGSLYWNINENATIYARYKDKNNYQIKRLEIFLYDDKKYDIVTSCGNCKEKGAAVRAGGVVHIDDIHSPSVLFSTNNEGGYCCHGADVIVYYEPVGAGSTVSEGNILIILFAAAFGILAVAIIVNKRKQTE